jgi:hypothetical protein
LAEANNQLLLSNWTAPDVFPGKVIAVMPASSGDNHAEESRLTAGQEALPVPKK